MYTMYSSCTPILNEDGTTIFYILQVHSLLSSEQVIQMQENVMKLTKNPRRRYLKFIWQEHWLLATKRGV